MIKMCLKLIENAFIVFKLIQSLPCELEFPMLSLELVSSRRVEEGPQKQRYEISSKHAMVDSPSILPLSTVQDLR